MRILRVVLFFIAANALGDTYVLRGTLVTPDTVIENGMLIVTDGVIADVGTALAIPARVIDTGGFIYPGLIDLHNHLTWNAHPRYSPGTLTRSRYEWQALDSYAAKLAGPQAAVRAVAGCDLQRFGEIKAMVWGATSVTGGLFEETQQFLKPGLIIIHGVPLLEKDFANLGGKGVGFVWSPRSNDELYGRTADVAAARKHVTIAIAPDWSPSGSNGMIDEMRYAAFWNSRQFPPVFTSQELVRMATTNPAKLARIDSKVGSLAKGLIADYVVVRRGKLTDPHDSLIYASHENMLLMFQLPMAGLAECP